MLKINNLRAGIGDKEILKGVSLEIERGEVVALMGPNGSGKSSLAQVLSGNENYQLLGGEVFFDGIDLLALRPWERARAGLMQAFQYPSSISGVRVREVVLTSLRAKEGVGVSALEVKNKIKEEAKRLGIREELLERGVNDGFSGGEKKRMEILQMAILKPRLLILDEIDSGLDIDALRVIADRVSEMVKENGMSVLVITHYKRLLEYLSPDRVAVMKDGRIDRLGGVEVVHELEKNGYK